METEATTVAQRISGIKNEITIDHPVLSQLKIQQLNS
jgi:hypothetical protein